MHEELHGRSFELRKHVLLDDLFDDQWYGDNNLRLHFGKCLENDLRARHTGEEVYMATVAEFIEKFECKTVHVCHRQHGYDAIARLEYLIEFFLTEFDVGPHGSGREHNTLREAGCTRCIVQYEQLVCTVLIIIDVFLAEILRELLAKEFVEMFTGKSELFAS